MKSKPVSHKTLNTFHFSTFAERLNNVNVSVIRQSDIVYLEGRNTYFWEAFEKWRDRDYSLDYDDFRKDIGDEIETLEQILHRKDEIVQILLKYLKKEGSLAIPAILELIVALARDLQDVLYPHFPEFFSAITSHFSTQDTDLLEKLFMCLAYLFKFFWRYMVKDIRNVYSLFSSLLNDSNKEHIRVFACESFGFLIRKVRSREELFTYVFNGLRKRPELTFGVGQLLFEVVKGIKQQFHSCIESVMKVLLKFLGKEDLSPNLIEEAILQMMSAMARHTVQKHCPIVQKILCNGVGELLKVFNNADSMDDSKVKHLDHMLHLLLFWINFKNGRLITSEDSLIELIVQLSGFNALPDYCLKSVAEITSSVLLSGCLKLPIDKLNTVVTQVYSCSEEIIFFFTRNMFEYGMFEKDILPVVLSVCLKSLQNGEYSRKCGVLQILSEIVTSLRPIIASEDDVKSFSKLYLHVSTAKVPNKDSLPAVSYSVLEEFLMQILGRSEIKKCDLPEIWSALVCLPHIRFGNTDEAITVLQDLSRKISEALLSIQSPTPQELEEFGFVLCQAYFAFLIISNGVRKGMFETSFFLDLLKKFPTCVSILRMVYCYFSSFTTAPVIEGLSDIISVIIPNLASPYHLIRMFTLKILKTFDSQLGVSGNEVSSVFAICFEAEKIPLDVQNYREKLKWLRKLEYDFIQRGMPAAYDTLLKKACTCYLLGMLHVNFKLLWDPTHNLLETFAHGAPKLFWEIFGSHLTSIVQLCVEFTSTGSCFPIAKWEAEDSSAYVKSLKSCCEPTENPDIMNHRLLLWKSMEYFPDIVEARNKVIVPLLFQLMVNEVVKVDTLMASTEAVNKNAAAEQSASNSMLEDPEIPYEEVTVKSLKRKRKSTVQSKAKKCKQTESVEDMVTEDLDTTEQSVLDETELNVEEQSDAEELDSDNEEDSDSESDGEDLDDSKVSVPKKKSSNKRRFHVTKTLAAYLSVFAKFRNPKSGYKYVELQTLYNELLSYHDPNIQKLAFDCLITFNYKFLTPYKDNFYRILDNKTFKTEVVLFSLDKENEVIQEEHRLSALAILMRILYGKMLHKTGAHTTGKSLANARRSLVLRFLAGCKAEELKLFFELVFIPFKEQLNDDTLVAVRNIKENMDLSNIVPIRRQHSALNTLAFILKHLGNLVPELLPYLLKVLLIITATSTTLLEKRSEVLPQCVNLLKSVRTLAVMRLIQFFKSFSDYKFAPEEIDAIFESIVWPMLPRLELESVNQPSPLLRLFATWSENPRYFVLFAKYHEKSETLTPLRHIMDLYCSNRAKARIVGVVSKIIYLLLTTETKVPDDETSQKLSPIEVNFCLQLPDVTIEGVESDMGTKLLLPYVDKILSRFEMTARILSRKKIRKSLPKRDLTILLRISRFVQDAEQSSKLIQLLPPFLMKPKIDHDSEVLILKTTSNLIKKCKNPDYFIRLFAPLFGKLSNQNSRTSLVAVFTAIAEIRPEMQELTNIVSKVNAFDFNLIEEPDYQLRLDGHKETLEIVKSMEKESCNVDFIRIVIFNSSYMIRMCDDMALRNSSSYMLQELAKILSGTISSSPDLTRTLLYDTLLPEVQKGLKYSAEAIRHEFIQILSAILNFWKDQPSLKDLVVLSHEDKELDFWENVRHLQVHRRARALLRFSNILRSQCENEEKTPVHYLTAYMLPIVSSFLFDAAYKKHIHVIDAAIETLGSIALALPWQHYEPLLKQYLQMLSTDFENHKTIIKIVVSLLNSFHFKVASKQDTASSESIKAEDNESKLEDNQMQMDDNTQNNILVSAPVDADVAQLKSAAAAESNKIYLTIRKNILPLLHRSLMRKTKSDDEHKLAGHYYPEDEEILRVPIALAMVKLLQNLPVEILEKNLPGLFLRMCDLLKTRTESIRQMTRETLVKMLESLGPKYFPCLVSEMKGVMKKGYQVHVMTYTINAVMVKLAGQMKPGDLDACANNLIEICTNELFTDVAEEKEVEKITGKLKEARSVKSYSIFQVLSKFVSDSYLLKIITPLKEALGKRHSHKIMKKVSESLRHIALGLSENKSVTNEKQLMFIHGIVNESVPGLNKKKIDPPKSQRFERPDIHLIPKEPGRSGPPAKINVRTTDHVLVEFGLQLFHFSLKRDQIDKNKKEILEMLDPFVSILSDCLSSNHIKIITAALRCLLPLYKYSLPAFKTVSKKIVSSLFILVNKYAAVGMGQGENFEMIVMCFKVFTVLVRDTTYHTLSEQQLKSLLSYIEQDIYDYTRQATAFTLLKAILSKKLQTPELRSIMCKMSEMSITADQDYIRAQCRQVCLQYMLDYPLGKQLVKSVSFFVAQLEYIHEHGRVSALEMINSMLNNFPDDVLKSHSALLLVPLAARLVNDESHSCRKMCAMCIKKLLAKVEHDGRQGLFTVPLNWLKEKKVSHKRLGAQLCGIFAEVAGDEFEHHLHEVLPLITELIISAKNTEAKSSTDERCADHFLYHVLNSLTKMLSFCPVIRNKEFSDNLDLLWGELQGLILYPHVWVRLATSQLFGLLLSAYTVEEIEKAICMKNKTNSIFLNTKQKLRDLSADFSTQLQSPFLNEKLGEQISRNLVYLARVISRLPESSEAEGDSTEVTIEWILRKLCREAKMEVAEQPDNIQRRKYVFMFMAAFAHEMGKEKVLPLLSTILVPLSREISDNSKYPNEELRKCAQEVLDLIRTVVGVEDFTTIYSSVQMSLMKKKVKRKQEKASEAVTNPQKYAEKRIKKQLSKKESKKRKIMKLKGKKKVKKTKLTDLVIAS